MTMSCREARRWISVKVDRQPLPPAAAEMLDGHLGACPSCRGLFSVESRRSALLVATLDPGDSAPLAASILHALDASGGVSPRVMRPWHRVPLQAAALLIVIAGAWFAFRAAVPGGGDSAISTLPGGGSPRPAVRQPRIIVEQDLWGGDVIRWTDGSPVGRERRHHRQFILEPPPPGGEEGADPAPKRLEKINTEYLKLIDHPYW